VNTTAKVQHLEGTDFQKSRGFSPAVITEGGKTVWLAGLEGAGGSLANLVTMTVFINDARNGDRFVQIRRNKW